MSAQSVSICIWIQNYTWDTIVSCQLILLLLLGCFIMFESFDKCMICLVSVYIIAVLTSTCIGELFGSPGICYPKKIIHRFICYLDEWKSSGFGRVIGALSTVFTIIVFVPLSSICMDIVWCGQYL